MSGFDDAGTGFDDAGTGFSQTGDPTEVVLVGSASSANAASGALAGTVPVSGSAPAAFVASGVLARLVPVSGSAPSSMQASGSGQVVSLVGKSLSIVWDVVGTVQKSLDVVWDIGGPTQKSLVVRWDVLAPGGAGFANRWTFTDAMAGETYTFEVSPNSGGSFGVSKTMTYSRPTAPGSRKIVFEGRDAPRGTSISGSVLTKEGVLALEHWYSKQNQIKVTDDLGRESWVRIMNLRLERAQTYQHRWRHTFQIQLSELDWS